MKELVAQAKKEGKLNDIALPDDWANYGGISRPSRRSTASSSRATTRAARRRQENQAIVSLKGDPRAPDCVDVTVAIAVEGVAAGLYARYFVSKYKTIPRAMKDTRGFWTGDYWGAVSIGYNADLVSTPPSTFADLSSRSTRTRSR